jgi:hypothetical protein
VKVEVALGEHGEKHQPAREHGLHDRQRRERKRTDVKPPRGHRDRPTEREPAGSEQAHCAAQRMTRPHRRRQHRATLLEQKRDVRAQRRAQRQPQPSNHRPIFSGDQTRRDGYGGGRAGRLEPGHDVVADARCLVVQQGAGGSPSRAIASGRRSGGRADRVGLRWFGARPLARCAVAVWRRLPPRPAVIPGRHSARHAYAPPNCVPSPSSSSSLPVPLGLARKEHEDPRGSDTLGRDHRAGGITPVEVRHQPRSQTSNPRLSPRGARSAVGGIRAWAENPGRRASSCSTLLLSQAFTCTSPK